MKTEYLFKPELIKEKLIYWLVWKTLSLICPHYDNQPTIEKIAQVAACLCWVSIGFGEDDPKTKKVLDYIS